MPGIRETRRLPYSAEQMLRGVEHERDTLAGAIDLLHHFAHRTRWTHSQIR